MGDGTRPGLPAPMPDQRRSGERREACDEPCDTEFRIAALWVEVAIAKAKLGQPGAAADAERWLGMLEAGDYSFVPEAADG